METGTLVLLSTVVMGSLLVLGVWWAMKHDTIGYNLES